MGAYDGNSRTDVSYMRENRSHWNPNMDSGGGIGNLVDKLSGFGVNDDTTNDDASLIQVMKAVEAAESTIKQQVEENNRLRAELQRRTQEFERHKSDVSTSLRHEPHNLRNEDIRGPYNEEGRVRWTDHTSFLDPQGTLFLHQNLIQKSENPLHTHAEQQQYPERNQVNGGLKGFPPGQVAVDNIGSSQFFSPSSRSLSPSRNKKEGEYDPRSNLAGHGIMQVSVADRRSILLKQDLSLKIREHEEEILQLRRHLADYSIKEAQIRNEKHVLEKRIAYMRMAFDKQQQDLVDAASKSLSYRQDIIEENIRLTYALQAAQQERSTFISSLLPLLAEYSLQPPVLDAQSIVNNLKVLYKHLQEKLLVTEEKLKESQYQIAPWHSDPLNHSPLTPQSPSPSINAALTISHKNGLELVAQPTYSNQRTQEALPSNARTTADWDPSGQSTYSNHAGLVGVAKNPLPDNFGRSPLSATRNSESQDSSTTLITQGNSHAVHFNGGTPRNQQQSFNELLHGGEMDDTNTRELSTNWGSGTSPYMTPTHDDANSPFSPYLPPVLEEPSSSFSEAAEEDPLPAIDNLQISGEAFPGRELQACGFSINGTTSCNFEWVRYLENGSVNYIDGAKQPNYMVTADDVDSYLAIEVQPLDNRKRKGELVKVFANEQRKIACDPEMQDQIEKTHYSGRASYAVSLAVGYLDIWEEAILAIKREGYSIKCVGPRGVVVTEKFQPGTSVTLSYGLPTAFSILSSSGAEHVIGTESSLMRDTIVLTLRLFILRAVEKRKGKKKGLFFNK